MKKNRTLWNDGTKTVAASLLSILMGVVFGGMLLLVAALCLGMPGSAAWEGFRIVLAGVFNTGRDYDAGSVLTFGLNARLIGDMLFRATPLIMTGLSVALAYKTGLFNIGAAGQYVVGAGACLYCALALKMPWIVCLIVAVIAAALVGGISGALKAYFNVNEVISCIMLNWISLYCVNMLLAKVKEQSTPYTIPLSTGNPGALLPNMGLDKLFSKNEFVTIGLPLAVIMAILVWVLLEKTKFGYELKATGLNKNAAKYCGMKEQRNVILTMMIAGGLAGCAAGIYYLTGIEQWMVQQTSVPAMGFNGIAAAFLGGLHPVGAIFSSYFIEHITSGGAYVDKTMYCAQISDFISSLIIYLCGFVLFFKSCMGRSADKARDKKQAKTAGQEGGGK